jgi:hypothetical protein
MSSAINAEQNFDVTKGQGVMTNIAVLGKIRKAILWTAISAAAFFGIIAVISLILSSGALKKPMQYRKVVPELKLKPGERKVFQFESFCLDNHRGGPRSTDAYALMSTPAINLRPYLREIFDEYLSHPSRWKQGDVQQAVWYTEGHKKWKTLSPEQQKLIRSATGKEDPVSGHPVIFLGRMTSAFGTVVRTNLFLAFIAFGLVVLTLSTPSAFIERSISWMVTPRIAQKLFRSRLGEGLNTLAANKGLDSFRVQLDVLFTRLVFRLFSRRR